MLLIAKLFRKPESWGKNRSHYSSWFEGCVGSKVDEFSHLDNSSYYVSLGVFLHLLNDCPASVEIMFLDSKDFKMLNFSRTCCVSLMVLNVVPTFSGNWFQFFLHSSRSCGLTRRFSGSALSALQSLRPDCGIFFESQKCFSNFFKSNIVGSGCLKSSNCEKIEQWLLPYPLLQFLAVAASKSCPDKVCKVSVLRIFLIG